MDSGIHGNSPFFPNTPQEIQKQESTPTQPADKVEPQEKATLDDIKQLLTPKETLKKQAVELEKTLLNLNNEKNQLESQSKFAFNQSDYLNISSRIANIQKEIEENQSRLKQIHIEMAAYPAIKESQQLRKPDDTQDIYSVKESEKLEAQLKSWKSLKQQATEKHEAILSDLLSDACPEELAQKLRLQLKHFDDQIAKADEKIGKLQEELSTLRMIDFVEVFSEVPERLDITSQKFSEAKSFTHEISDNQTPAPARDTASTQSSYKVNDRSEVESRTDAKEKKYLSVKNSFKNWTTSIQNKSSNMFQSLKKFPQYIREQTDYIREQIDLARQVKETTSGISEEQLSAKSNYFAKQFNKLGVFRTQDSFKNPKDASQRGIVKQENCRNKVEWYEKINEIMAEHVDQIGDVIVNSIVDVGSSMCRGKYNNYAMHLLDVPSINSDGSFTGVVINDEGKEIEITFRVPPNILNETKVDGKTVIELYFNEHDKTNCDQSSVAPKKNGYQTFAFADGCSAGERVAQVATTFSELASRFAQQYLDKLYKRDKQITLKDVAKAHCYGIKKAEEKLPSENDDKGARKTTFHLSTVIGDTIVSTSAGDVKALILRKDNEGMKVVDLNSENRKNCFGVRDPGGLVSANECDLRNFQICAYKLKPNDTIFVCSDGTHDNLDPSQLQEPVTQVAERYKKSLPPGIKTWADLQINNPDLNNQLRTAYITDKVAEIVGDTTKPEDITKRFQKYIEKTTFKLKEAEIIRNNEKNSQLKAENELKPEEEKLLKKEKALKDTESRLKAEGNILKEEFDSLRIKKSALSEEDARLDIEEHSLFSSRALLSSGDYELQKLKTEKERSNYDREYKEFTLEHTELKLKIEELKLKIEELKLDKAIFKKEKADFDKKKKPFSEKMKYLSELGKNSPGKYDHASSICFKYTPNVPR